MVVASIASRRKSEARVGQCKECRAEVLFIRNPKTQRWIPVDRRPLQGVTDDGTVVRIREAHAATCPYRDAVLAREAQERHRKEVEKEK